MWVQRNHSRCAQHVKEHFSVEWKWISNVQLMSCLKEPEIYFFLKALDFCNDSHKLHIYSFSNDEYIYKDENSLKSLVITHSRQQRSTPPVMCSAHPHWFPSTQSLFYMTLQLITSCVSYPILSNRRLCVCVRACMWCMCLCHTHA